MKDAQTADHNAAKRAQAHRRLDTLLDEAERCELYGSVTVHVQLERGRITTLRRRMLATEK